MAETSNDNIFASLKGLIWGAFIGVVSFQILAPNIWDYLHSSMGINYANAYWLFTLIYFLILPLIFIIWTWWNIKPIKTCLPPYDETEQLEKHSNFFITALRIFIVIQSLITVIFFFNHIADSIFTLIMIIYAFWSMVLLFFCFAYSLGCIHSYLYDDSLKSNTNFTTGFKTFFSYIFSKKKKAENETGEGQSIRKEEEKFYRSFIQFAVSAVLMLVLLFAIGFTYLHNWEASKNENLSSRKAGERGFALLNLKETIDSTQKAIVEIQDSLNEAKAAGDLHDSLYLLTSMQVVLNRSQLASGLVDSLHIIDSVKKRILQTHTSLKIAGASKDSVTKWDSARNYVIQIGDSLKHAARVDYLADSTSRATALHAQLNPHNKTIEYARVLDTLRKSLFAELNVAGDIKNDSGRIDSVKEKIIALDNQLKQLRLPDSINIKDLVYLEMQRGVLSELSKKTEATAQSQLGLQLRSVQAKGMMLLLSLFFTILALYIFLKTNQDIRNVKLQEMLLDKRIGNNPNELVLCEKEKRVSEMNSLSGTLWMFLTVTAWLLIPIFKMVKDDEIDIRSPYKAVTFSNPQNEVTVGLTGSKAKADSSYIKIGGSVSVIDTSGKYDIEEIKHKLDSIKTNIKSIDATVKPIQNY